MSEQQYNQKELMGRMYVIHNIMFELVVRDPMRLAYEAGLRVEYEHLLRMDQELRLAKEVQHKRKKSDVQDKMDKFAEEYNNIKTEKEIAHKLRKIMRPLDKPDDKNKGKDADE